MKRKEENQRKRSKTLVWNTKESKTWKKEIESILEGRSRVGKKNGRIQYELGYERKEGSSLRRGRQERKELEVSRTRPRGWRKEGQREQSSEIVEDLKKRIKKERDLVCEKVKARSVKKRGTSELDRKKTQEVREWKEQVVRVGTGYRVRKDEKDPQKRRFDVGYSDLKTYKRKEGREGSVESSNIGRTILGKGKDARVRVINAVSAIEKRRPVSEYTGSGIRRKSRVGKLKLKPTKPSGKE